MTVTVRQAQNSDIPAMTALLEELFSLERDFAPDPAKQRRALAMLLAAPRAVALVAEDTGTGRAIGMVTAQAVVSTAEGGMSAWVEDVVVAREHRGRGTGTRLLAAVASWARQHGARRLQLLADSGNAAALAFYRTLGWRRANMICLRHFICPPRTKAQGSLATPTGDFQLRVTTRDTGRTA